jgi:hypothetical protein
MAGEGVIGARKGGAEDYRQNGKFAHDHWGALRSELPVENDTTTVATFQENSGELECCSTVTRTASGAAK